MEIKLQIAQEEHDWRPPRLNLDPSDIGIVHFSGDVHFRYASVTAGLQATPSAYGGRLQPAYTKQDSLRVVFV